MYLASSTGCVSLALGQILQPAPATAFGGMESREARPFSSHPFHPLIVPSPRGSPMTG